MAIKKLTVLASSSQLYTTKRLLTEGNKLKLSSHFISPAETNLIFPPKPFRPTSSQELLFHRTTGINYDDIDLLISSYQQSLGAKVTNPLGPLKEMRSKDFQALFFQNHRVPFIPTLIYRGHLNDQLCHQLQKLSPSRRYVVKMSRGNQGIGVNLLESFKSLTSFLETFHALSDQKFLIQPFIEQKREWRVFNLKGIPLAIIEKKLKNHEFRGNAKRSEGKLINKFPSIDIQDEVMRIFEHTHLDYAGIDLMEDKFGNYFFVEINPVPGFEQIESLSKKNIARELILQISK